MARQSEQKTYYGYDEDDRVLEAELGHIRKRSGSEDRSGKDLAGIALSGGGIRSAVFSLGVMQALARNGLMRRFDYLSTASGGGYIGSSLTWFLSKWPDRFNTSEDGFPFGTHRRGSAAQGASHEKMSVLRYIRQARNFLFPGGGIGPLSMVGVVTRGILVNFAVYLSLLLGVVTAWLWLSTHLRPLPESLLGWTGLRILSTSTGFAIALLSIVALASASALYILATPLIVRYKGTWAYALRRIYEMLCTLCGSLAVAAVLLGMLPVVDGYLESRFASGGLTVSGLLLGLWTFIRSEKATLLKVPMEVVASAASALLLYGLLLGAYAIAGSLLTVGADVALVCVGAVLLGLIAKMNFLTVHRYYRDRLMETFLPDLESVVENKHEPAKQANSYSIRCACDFDSGAQEKAFSVDAPYHLINTNVVLADSRITKYRTRGGDSFILSPLFCGSRATGWVKTGAFLGGHLTLPTAMAISGAALAPGAGPTRNPFLSILMSLLNLQLGYWVRNPFRRTQGFHPNILIPGIWQILRGVKRMDERSGYVQLTDGGHFENLAIYELIRRKVKLIVVVDGVADPGCAFEDFGNALEKIRVDFGAKIDIDLSPLVPQTRAVRPADRKLASSGHAIGKITYADRSEGYLVYIGTTLVGGLPEDLYSYADSHTEFPDQSTADQFFDEKQFEAYRELGYQLGDRAVNALRHAQLESNGGGAYEVFYPKQRRAIK